ncbi:MAG: twin-arginine translocation signal domain-containing protein [Candidatus Brocadiaceae bacterium]|nr:twin-arginine translocation signal domain-containing protein [Candidatus Brocadiaceae bacterium]
MTAGSDRKPPEVTRREFLGRLGCGASALALGGLTAALVTRAEPEGQVWQIDPFKCVQCEQCRTHCVLDQSAVRCVHDFSMCGYCEFCFGFFRHDALALTEAAENQSCPTAALVRRGVGDPYFEYTVERDLCIGCGRCVKGCNQFGNGALYLQVQQDLCLNCSECAIAAACPADAFVRLPAGQPYFVKHVGPDQLSDVKVTW